MTVVTERRVSKVQMGAGTRPGETSAVFARSVTRAGAWFTITLLSTTAFMIGFAERKGLLAGVGFFRHFNDFQIFAGSNKHAANRAVRFEELSSPRSGVLDAAEGYGFAQRHARFDAIAGYLGYSLHLLFSARNSRTIRSLCGGAAAAARSWLVHRSRFWRD